MKKLLSILTLIFTLTLSLGIFTACHTHAWGNWVSNNNGTHSRVCAYDASHIETLDCSGGQATCSAKAKCVICLTTYDDALGHNWITGKCTRCGEIKDLYFNSINNGTEYEVLYCTGTPTEVYIPSVYNNKPVTSIGSSAFSNCSSLTSVVIGNSITSIGYRAFSGCSSLTSIVIPDSVTSIDSWAFSGCSSLTSIVIPDSVTSIDSWAFSGCSSLTYNIKDGLKYLGNTNNPYLYLADTESFSITTATIDNNCKFIASSAFYECRSLTSIEIPESVTSIGDGAFYNCSSLTSIEIPESVTSIGNAAFSYCDSLTSVTFNDTSTWYRTSSYENWQNKTGGTEIDVTDSTKNASYLKDYYYWYKL